MSLVFKIPGWHLLSDCNTLNRFNVREHRFEAHRKPVFDRGPIAISVWARKNGAETQSLKNGGSKVREEQKRNSC